MRRRELAVRLWAQHLKLGNALYKDIPVGGLFYFRGATAICRSLGRGWYTVNGRKYRTGAYAVVVSASRA
jgi:hypothetical protein